MDVAHKAKLCPVIVVDVDRMQHVCMDIYDVTETGCFIVGKKEQIGNLSPSIYLIVNDVNKLLNGQIIWRENDRAEVLFEQGNAEPEDQRSEYRINVSFPAIIDDMSSGKSEDCVICDASKSGCRVRVKNGFEWSDDIVLFTKTFGRSISGRVIWRSERVIAIRFNWAAKPPDVARPAADDQPVATESCD